MLTRDVKDPRINGQHELAHLKNEIFYAASKSGYTRQEIAIHFGISQTRVNQRVARYECWKNLYFPKRRDVGRIQDPDFINQEYKGAWLTGSGIG